MTQKKTNKRILSDHKKVGKKLIPPLLSVIGESDFSYVKKGIPQIIWLSLLIEKLGLKKGTELAVDFAKIIDELEIKKDVPYYISWFTDINETDEKLIKDKLRLHNVYDKINIALSDLLNVYPDCPLNKIFESKKFDNSNIETIKKLLISLYNKQSKEATFSLANAVHLMGVCGKLQMTKKTEIRDFNNIIDYPETDDSRMIASFVRATTNLMLSDQIIENSNEWVSYFWNRGLELEPCEI